MARKAPQPHGGSITLLEKGETANPNGRPPKLVGGIIAELRAKGYENVGRANVEDTIATLLQLEPDQLQEYAKRKDIPILMGIVARNLIKSGKDVRIFDVLLDRIFGKAVQKNEHTGKDGEPLQITRTIIRKTIEP